MSNSFTVTNCFGQTYMVSNVSSINEAYKIADRKGPQLPITQDFNRSDEDFKRDYLHAKEKLENEKPISGNDILRHEGYRILVKYIETHRPDIIKLL